MVAGVELLARGSFQRRNFALARSAAEAYLGGLDPLKVAAQRAAAATAAHLAGHGFAEVADSRAAVHVDASAMKEAQP